MNEDLGDIILKISVKFHDKFIKTSSNDETRNIALTYTTFVLTEYLKMMEERINEQ